MFLVCEINKQKDYPFTLLFNLKLALVALCVYVGCDYYMIYSRFIYYWRSNIVLSPNQIVLKRPNTQIMEEFWKFFIIKVLQDTPCIRPKRQYNLQLSSFLKSLLIKTTLCNICHGWDIC